MLGELLVKPAPVADAVSKPRFLSPAAGGKEPRFRNRDMLGEMLVKPAPVADAVSKPRFLSPAAGGKEPRFRNRDMLGEMLGKPAPVADAVSKPRFLSPAAGGEEPRFRNRDMPGEMLGKPAPVADVVSKPRFLSPAAGGKEPRFRNRDMPGELLVKPAPVADVVSKPRFLSPAAGGKGTEIACPLGIRNRDMLGELLVKPAPVAAAISKPRFLSPAAGGEEPRFLNPGSFSLMPSFLAEVSASDSFLEMSRRARRRKGAGKNPWFGKVVVAFGALLIVGAGVGFLGLRAYLHSEGFRKFLSVQVSSAAKVKGEFASFYWDGLAVETEAFEATGEGLVRSLRADLIDTEVGFGGLGRGVWEIKSTHINRIEVVIDATKSDEPQPVEPKILEEKVVKKQPGWVPEEVELESLEIGEVAVSVVTEKGPASATGMAVQILPGSGKNSYKAEIVGGDIVLPQEWLPEFRVKRITGTYRDGSAFITRAEASAWKEGRILAFGEWNFDQDFFAFEGDIEGIRCEEILNENWARRLTGDISSSYSVENRSGSMRMSGEMEIRNGTLTALPMLEALAAYADTRRFRVLQLNEAKTKWSYSDGEIRLNDFVMGSEGLIRIEGNLSIRGREIEGRFQLGLVPGTLANIPGAETDVFKPGPHGLLWAPLHLTGTLDDPKEDLTNRLIDAAGARMFELLPETGERVFRFTRNALGEAPVKAIEQGRRIIDESGKVIEEGEKVLKEAEGIFRGIFGN